MHAPYFLALSAATAAALSICGGEGSGYVGVGTTQNCDYGSMPGECSEAAGAIYAGNCDIQAVENNLNGGGDGYCSTTWTDGYYVNCASGKPTYVHTSDKGNYGNCVEPFGGSSCAVLGSNNYVDYCCSYVSG